MVTAIPASPRPRIVAIDDSAVQLKWLQGALQPDFQVATTTSVTALPTLLAYSGRPTIVLVDINMPGLGGGEVVRGLADARFPDTWFYLHSSIAEQQARDLARECGADGFVPKTSRPDELRAALLQIVAQRSRRRILVAGTEAARLLPDRAELARTFDLVEQRSIKIIQQQLGLALPHVLVGSGALIDGRVEDLYRAIRRNITTRRLSILHLTASPGAGMDRDLRDAGANIVVGAATSPAAFRDIIARLANVAPRRDVRVPLDVKVTVADCGLRGTTRNLSVSGMLAAFDGDVALGTGVAVEFALPGRDRKISAVTRIVRGQSANLGQYAFGLQFTSLREDDFDAIAGYVAEHL